MQCVCFFSPRPMGIIELFFFVQCLFICSCNIFYFGTCMLFLSIANGFTTKVSEITSPPSPLVPPVLKFLFISYSKSSSSSSQFRVPSHSVTLKALPRRWAFRTLTMPAIPPSPEPRCGTAQHLAGPVVGHPPSPLKSLRRRWMRFSDNSDAPPPPNLTPPPNAVSAHGLPRGPRRSSP